jgi:hypothetical protein
VEFNSPSTAAPIQYGIGDDEITLTANGVYRVTFQVSSSTGGGNVWGITVGGTSIQPQTFVSRSGNSQIWGDFLINVTTAPVVLALTNLGGDNTSITNGLASDPGTSVSASVVIEKLS